MRVHREGAPGAMVLSAPQLGGHPNGAATWHVPVHTDRVTLCHSVQMSHGIRFRPHFSGSLRP